MIAHERFRAILLQTVGIPAAALALLAGLFLWQLASLLNAAAWVDHTDQVIAQEHRCHREMEQLPSLHRAFLLTGDEWYRVRWQEIRRDLETDFRSLERQVADNPSQEHAAITLHSEVLHLTSLWVKQVGELGRGVDPRAIARRREDAALLAEFRAGCDRFVATEESLRNSRSQAARRAADVTRATVVISLTLLGALLGTLIVRQLSGLAASYHSALESVQSQAEAVRQRTEEVHKLNSELERRVADRTAQLRMSNHELETFSYSVSHDLRAPLRSIDGMGQALVEDYYSEIGPDGRMYIDRIRANTHQMAALIDAMLDLSRLARRTMQIESVDLSGVAEEVVADLRSRDPEREVVVEIAPGVRANGDARLLRAVLGNLLGNAWKYTSKSPSPRITFGWSGEPDMMTYFVKDNGVGFDMAYYDKLFDAFQRLHSIGEFDGLGIGLATVQRIVRRHGGHAWAEGAVGEGAAFYFTLGRAGADGTRAWAGDADPSCA